ncbi:biliverdin-producing heme oxygenase [Sphingobacterium mizutaii]|uniref:biliverdin-producing heme oxygenase n=1 Tax=Sphingobacterium mizutaii TaxID=1010 RepID=UPI0016236F5A|nr:biliverdin-producing heme oxygenase [Sphingobacterium mizutaii]
MLNEQIKSATKQGHQDLEKHVVYRLKAIESPEDYAEVLKFFFAYFQALEVEIEKYLPESIKPYFSVRRNAADIEKDILALGSSIKILPQAHFPEIKNKNQAIGALYVLEGSIMGGPYIVKMLQQRGIEKGFNFFQGYGESSGSKWTEFTGLINLEISEQMDIQEAVQAAEETFQQFTNTFKNNINASLS